METGRSLKEIESGMFIKENINVGGEDLELTITSKQVEVRHNNTIKNRFNYSGEIDKSIITDLATIIVDIGAFEKKKEARSWIVNQDIFSKINSAKRILDIKIKEFQKDFKLDESIMVFNEDYITMAEKFWDVQPFYFDKSNIWWLWNFTDKYWEMIDEVDLFNILRENSSPFMNITKSSTFSQIIKSMQMVGRKKKPKEAPVRWIQFKDKAFSLRSGKIHDVTKDYFFTNPIPWKIGEKSDTPTLDKLFTEWVGEKYVQTLYEIIAYCIYADYPIQVLFCLYGGGRNGKTCFLKVLSKFIGKSNICSTDLDLLVGNNKSRFEVFKLYKKLCCLMGETNFGILQSSAILKKLTGGDLIGFEIKGKQPFDDINYAKILIASNSLPSSEDTSDGFFRRWVIIDFPNQFNEGKDITLTIPDEEFNNLAKKSCEIIPKIIEDGKFTNQGSIEDRKNKYIMASNPLPYFIETHMFQNPINYIRYSTFYMAYTKFLARNNKRIVSKKEFSKILVAEGFENRRTSKEGDIDYYVEGLELKPEEDLPDLPDFKKFPLNPYTRSSELKNTEIKTIKTKSDERSPNRSSFISNDENNEKNIKIEEEEIIDNEKEIIENILYAVPTKDTPQDVVVEEKEVSNDS